MTDEQYWHRPLWKSGLRASGPQLPADRNGLLSSRNLWLRIPFAMFAPAAG